MALIFIDKETVGLVGSTRLIQYAVNDGPVNFIVCKRDNFPEQEIRKYLSLLDDENNTVIGYNVGFDLFHAYKLKHVAGFSRENIRPFKCKVLDLQIKARELSPLAPFAFSKKGDKAVARVKRIPAQAREWVINYVTPKLQALVPDTVEVKPHTHEVKNQKAEVNPDFVDISWTTEVDFKLKTIMRCYGHNTQKIQDVWPLAKEEKKHIPFYQPCHAAIEPQIEEILNSEGKDYWHELSKRFKGAKEAEKQWKKDGKPFDPFWKYAADDIFYIQELYYEHFNKPEPDYNDICAHAVAYTHFYGFDLDIKELEKAKNKYENKMIEADSLGINLSSAPQKLEFLRQFHPHLCTTQKKVLQILAENGCEYSAKICQYSDNKQKRDQAVKLLESWDNRCYPDFNSQGTATNRMSGTGGLNYQGITSEKGGIREAILTAAGGDFSQLEICLAETIYDDPQLRENLANNLCMHCVGVTKYHPEATGLYTYDFVNTVRKDPDHPDFLKITRLRNETKSVNFGLQYGAEAQKIAETLGIPIEIANVIYEGYFETYSGVKAYKDKMTELFATGDTEKWALDSVEKMLDEVKDPMGFKRSFTFEKLVASTLWAAAMFRGLKTGLQGNVIRRKEKGSQSIDNAIRSALLGASLTIQKTVARQGINSPVQSTGSALTKMLMAELFETLGLPMMNIHDELQVSRCPWYNHEKTSELVNNFVNKYKKMFQFLKMDFAKTEKWADK